MSFDWKLIQGNATSKGFGWIFIKRLKYIVHGDVSYFTDNLGC